jgi:hypothetical protein
MLVREFYLEIELEDTSKPVRPSDASVAVFLSRHVTG